MDILQRYTSLAIFDKTNYCTENRKAEDQYELFLDYTSNSSLLGMPQRSDHKIAELRPGHPVRLRINGKSDFTLSGRKQRTYFEFDHIFEWVGSATKLEFKDFFEFGIIKTIPITACKLVDERKHFR